jgi:hypothetical protein
MNKPKFQSEIFQESNDKIEDYRRNSRKLKKKKKKKLDLHPKNVFDNPWNLYLKITYKLKVT